MSKVIYLSPSNHGTGANKCLKSGCYEDKHTRPMAEACKKYLEEKGFKVYIAPKDTSMSYRCNESDRVGADLHVPIHTNAASDKSIRYLMFMCYRTDGEYRKMFDAISPYLEEIYPGKKDATFVKRADLYEINNPKAKTFYCEMGFHTNSTDVNDFIHKSDAIGKALAQGICKHFGVSSSAPEVKKEEPAAAPAPVATSTPAKAPSTAAKVLKVARAEIGVKESPMNSNNVKYNTEYYGRAVSGSGYAWCAAFVWWVFKHAGCPELFFGGKKSAFCPTIADYYIINKQTVSKSKGQPGDIVLFDWNQNNSSDHIGIIESKNSDGSYVCIEGNTSVGNNSNGGQVMRRTRYQSQISWICRPKYTGTAAITPATSVSTNKLSVDGQWGQTTTRKTQQVLGTAVDGIVSGQLNSCKQYLQGCSTSSWKFVNYSAKGSQMVKAIQKLVGVTQDGKAGKATVKAMQTFLNKKGFDCGSADGYMGPKTIKAWQNYINSRI